MLTTPTTAQLSANIVSQIAAKLSQSVPFLPKAFIHVLASSVAGVVVILFRYSGFVFLQLFVAYATDQPTTVNGKIIRPLREWGRLIGVGDPRPAEQAQHKISVTVTTQLGELPAGTALLFPSTGVYYETNAVVALNAPTVTVHVRAVSDKAGGDGSGTIGNLQNGDVLEFANSPPNVVSKAPVTGQLVTGADAETTEEYRTRIIARFQAKPQGGAAADYRAWAQEVPGIVNVYPYAGYPGEVDVYCEATAASSGSDDGFPTEPQKSAVREAVYFDIDGLASRAPVNAAVNVLPIFRAAFTVQIAALQPDSPETRAAIETGINEHLRSLEPFIVGLSVLPRKDRITQANVGAVVDGIAAARAASVASVTLLENGQPLTARSLTKGEKAKLASGGVSYS
jgi:uncharacterized phage protein gp47/JayE